MQRRSRFSVKLRCRTFCSLQDKPVTDFVKNINNFNVIYLLTEDVYTTTNQAMASSQAKEVHLLVTWLFRLTQDYYNYKMASAIGIIVFIICAVFTLVAFNRMIKGDREGTYQ